MCAHVLYVGMSFSACVCDCITGGDSPPSGLIAADLCDVWIEGLRWQLMVVERTGQGQPNKGSEDLLLLVKEVAPHII